MSKVVDGLKHEFFDLHKVLLESSEDAHVDILFQQRMERAQLNAEEHLPEDSKELIEIKAKLLEVRKLFTKGLQHKESLK